MKLELKHLAAYLPYGLKINTIENELISIDIFNNILESKFRGHLINIYEWDDVKPILRPLSDLTTEEMEVIRNIMFPNAQQWTKQHWNFIKTVKCFPLLQDYYVVEYLKSIHVDIFNLIENNLAIPK